MFLPDKSFMRALEPANSSFVREPRLWIYNSTIEFFTKKRAAGIVILEGFYSRRLVIVKA